MKVRVSECKLRVGHTRQELEKKLCRILHIKKLPPYTIVRRSIDARRKPNLYFVYTIDLISDHPEKLVEQAQNPHVSLIETKEYLFVCSKKSVSDQDRPVIVGSGPAGLFCALMLSRAGMRPIVLERGESVEKREKSVNSFWDNGILNPSSNVQFGEGGAGTFSDGKLNTSIQDPDGRIKFVLQEFVRAGADSSVLWDSHPHIGTDGLILIVKHLRNEILSLGGEFRFETCLTDIKSLSDSDSPNGQRPSYLLTLNKGVETLQASRVVLAIGHSARDTFEMLYRFGILMEPKSFAVGFRTEHSQSEINQAMYGDLQPSGLPPASYKLTYKCQDGRGVYSFCMCPGGYVVNSSSEPGFTAVNGMSYSGRNGDNANSAIVVTVTPQDVKSYLKEDSLDRNPDLNSPLIGVNFQRMIEHKAWLCANGEIPVQRLEDFRENRQSKSPGSILPSIKGKWHMTNLRGILPGRCEDAILSGIEDFGKKIFGFDAPDVLLSGVESRTSSPVRMIRNENFQSSKYPGIFLCGEGAGYSGGITSSAIDGIRTAEAVATF